MRKKTKRYAGILASLILGFALCSVGRPRTFDWVRASDENAQLDPADFHQPRLREICHRKRTQPISIVAFRPLKAASGVAGCRKRQQHSGRARLPAVPPKSH
jgi:hypothetical protein